MYITLFAIILFMSPLALMSNESLEKDTEKTLKQSLEYAKFYKMPPNIDIKDITDELLVSSYVKTREKYGIKKYDRRVLVFNYPSDDLKIKGIISFVPDAHNHPTIVLLRGGNRTFAIPNPGSDLMCPEQCTVISTLYRGGICEGIDEFGGADVNDVNNLINYIPELEKKIGVSIQNQKMFLIGRSRGGMQMFLTLARFPELQARFSKVVSLCGLLDMRQAIADRSDMEEMFIRDFGLVKGVNDEEWINKRDPLLTVDELQPQLPILIIQGKDDIRVNLEEGYHMVDKLQSTGKNVTYWEIDKGDHCLENMPNRMQLILDWLCE